MGSIERTLVIMMLWLAIAPVFPGLIAVGFSLGGIFGGVLGFLVSAILIDIACDTLDDLRQRGG